MANEPYRTQIPNIVDDIGLDPFERSLYVHYVRVCGNAGSYCYETVKTTAQKLKMSDGQVSESRKNLAQKGLILVQPGRPVIVTIVDIWDLNRAYYQLENRPNIDSWTVEKIKLWLTNIHQVNVCSDNNGNVPAYSETNPPEDNKPSTNIHTVNKHSPGETNQPVNNDMSSNIHTVKQRRESLNKDSIPGQDSKRERVAPAPENYLQKLKRVGRVDFLAQNESFATKLTEICGNPHPRYVTDKNLAKLAEATAKLLDWGATIQALDDFKNGYWWGNAPPRFDQVVGDWGRYLSSMQNGRNGDTNGQHNGSSITASQPDASRASGQGAPRKTGGGAGGLSPARAAKLARLKR